MDINQQVITKVFWYTVSLFFVGSTGLMFNQYLVLKNEVDKLNTVHNDYNDCLAKLNAVIEDFQKSTDGNGDDCSDVDEKKKDNFVIVNRSPEYLSDSLVAYLKENNLTSELNQLRKMQYIKPVRNVIAQQSKQIRRPAKQKNITMLDIPKQIAKDVLFSWPLSLKSFWISSYFGPRKKVDKTPGFHYGLDLAALSGTIVKSAIDGKVVEAGPAAGYGNTIVVQHKNKKYKTRYAHLNAIGVRVGQLVNRGQKIGTVGNTGLVRSSGKDPSHLHFEVMVGNRKINPLWVLPKIS